MNYALIFAGGIGSRMNSSVPKQFLLVDDKPILVHTIEVFEKSNHIDKIVVVCLKEYVDEVKTYKQKYNLTKLFQVISGGETAFLSQRKGINFVHEDSKSDKDIVFIHDGVRPLINNEIIEKCLNQVKKTGSAITVSPAAETIAIMDDNETISKTMPRQKCVLARAPQAFYLKDVYEAHLLAQNNNKEYIDSASMFLDQGKPLSFVEGPTENIKITTQFDYSLCKLLLGRNKDE